MHSEGSLRFATTFQDKPACTRAHNDGVAPWAIIAHRQAFYHVACIATRAGQAPGHGPIQGPATRGVWIGSMGQTGAGSPSANVPGPEATGSTMIATKRGAGRGGPGPRAGPPTDVWTATT